MKEHQDQRNIAIYQSADGEAHIDARLEEGDVWPSQQQIARQSKTGRTSILRHIGNICRPHRLEEGSTCAEVAQVRIGRGRQEARAMPACNLGRPVSAGHRVCSRNATHFLRRAT